MATVRPLQQQAITDPIPEHLEPYIVAQEPEQYTAIDHAAWRFILKIAQAALSKAAHPHYISGLAATGISTDRIPLIEEMDICLRNYGWRAVGVSGFIPPAIFMEFQALGILPIACDMRKLENIAYTPAPDIVHEAAGHAPMIANPDYANYLRQYGDVARKAIYSKSDELTYLAIRNLSETKEDPFASEETILQAEEQLMHAEVSSEYTSEGAQLARFYWWTVEYGLIGTMTDPKIYGAGLLSSVGEAELCLKEGVAKIPFTLDLINTAYDITRPQPQLFVTPDFKALSHALEEFSKTMAYRQGGLKGLAKAKQAATVTTAMLDSGLQISGVLSGLSTTVDGTPIYLQYQGPTQLAYDDITLDGHGPDYHSQGYGTALGKIQGLHKALSDFLDSDWASCGFQDEHTGTLTFESGITVQGMLTHRLEKNGQTLVASFKDCTVTYHDQVLFSPDWGTYDLGCGELVTSVFGGAADRIRYLKHVEDKTLSQAAKRGQKSNRTPENTALIPLYAQVRALRDNSSNTKESLLADLTTILHTLEAQFPEDWLSRWELLELNQTLGLNAPWERDIRAQLKAFVENHPDKASLIQRGLELFPRMSRQ